MPVFDTDVSVENWNIMTPRLDVNGNAITYWHPNFPDDEFYHVNENGHIELWAPVKGGTSQLSERTRTEFREVRYKADGSGEQEQQNWQFSQYEKQILRVAMTMHQVPLNGRVCIGQIHVKNSTGPAIKLVWDNGRIKVTVRHSYDQEDPTPYTLLENVPVGARVNYSIHINKTGLVSVYVATSDGQSNDGAWQLDSTWNDKLLYFKAGIYNQADQLATTLDTEGSRVTIDKFPPVERYPLVA